MIWDDFGWLSSSLMPLYGGNSFRWMDEKTVRRANEFLHSRGYKLLSRDRPNEDEFENINNDKLVIIISQFEQHGR